MLSSKTIVDHISQPPSRQLAGKIAHAQQALKTRMGGTTAPESHSKFLDEMAAQSATANPTPASYQHPGNDPRARAVRPSTGLAPSDLAWISRLPQDPAQVSHEDAVALAGLASGLTAGSNPSDHRLVQSVWRPVQEHHDAAAAKVALSNASVQLPPAPSSALPALTAAVSNEVPTLAPSEAAGRAQSLLREALDKRSAARDAKVVAAQATIARAKEAAAARTATTR